MKPVPPIRVRVLNKAPADPGADYVLYWMIAHRRSGWNFALQRAVEWARELRRPLVVLEALRCDYRWASDRFHRFVLEGMADHDRRFEQAGVRYHPYVEPEVGAGKGLLEALAARACLVVTDDFPCFMLPRMVEAAAARLRVALEAVDSNGLLPLRAATRVYPTAYAFRRFLQKSLREHLAAFPEPDPLAGLRSRKASLPESVAERWPRADRRLLEAGPEMLSRLPIDHDVAPAEATGGESAAREALDRFLRGGLDRYAEERNHPDEDASSGLSPWLHFGQLSAHEVFTRVAEREDWSVERLSNKANGKRSGWWGMGEGAEAFLDQLVTWRELGFNMSWQRDDYDRYESLPPWALQTLAVHERDRRPYLYSLEALEGGQTDDRIWNAAQNQLVQQGRLHNYLRMLWGKKILAWTESPREALRVMIELNNKYALDGRDPNSYSGIFWVLGRYDRAWGPERPVFGKIRFMSSKNTLRKVRMQEYLDRFAPE